MTTPTPSLILNCWRIVKGVLAASTSELQANRILIASKSRWGRAAFNLMIVLKTDNTEEGLPHPNLLNNEHDGQHLPTCSNAASQHPMHHNPLADDAGGFLRLRSDRIFLFTNIIYLSLVYPGDERFEMYEYA